ncbi:MAG TPA: NEW3 domain-containing protein, partial [Gemmatimonadales bacterium]|nr:NEW3 domain-containing protein [Gemmatimonadales bacterium]
MRRLVRGSAVALAAVLAACHNEFPPVPPAVLATAAVAARAPLPAMAQHPRASAHPLAATRVAELVAAPEAIISATRGDVLWVGSAEPTAARPHTVQLVPVAVPAELAPGGDVQYAIVAEEGIRLVGSASGVVRQSDVGHRPLVVAASLPRSVPAGLQTIARVEYRQGGVLRQAVPVQVQVAQVPGAALRLNQGLVGARPGERLTLALTLTNTGNAADTIELRLQAPLGWHADNLPARYPLAPNASVAVEIHVSLPDAVSTGSVRLQLIAASHHLELARTDAMVEVLSPGATLAEGNGPRLTTGVASVLGNAGSSAPVFGLQLEGPLTGSIRVYGQAFIPTNAAATDVIGLSRVGYFLGNSVLTVATDRWSATAGATGRSFSEETGKNVFGRGGAVTYGDNSWTAAALVAQPAAGTTSASGHLYGASVGANLGAGWLSLTATDLDDGSLSGRTLQSVGLGATTDALRGVNLSAEVADRKYTGGSGFGWSFDAVHRSAGDYAEFRALNAPGGSAAFARASEEYSAAASHAFNTVLTLGGSAWTSSDHNSAIAKLRSSGWSLTPQVALSTHLSISATVHANSYDAQSGAGAFGSSEFGAQLTGSLRFGTV